MTYPISSHESETRLALADTTQPLLYLFPLLSPNSRFTFILPSPIPVSRGHELLHLLICFLYLDVVFLISRSTVHQSIILTNKSLLLHHYESLSPPLPPVTRSTTKSPGHGSSTTNVSFRWGYL
uniref:Uncharacterized protein n=1 Tax=Kalanchoe fedtschenkoi TaxID=63787 RepID=A0A7N0UJE2_KALFE